MKKNAIFQLILCLFLPSVITAQVYKDYDLNNYYTPDIVRNSLDLYLNSNGRFDNKLFRKSSFNTDRNNINDLNGQLKSRFTQFTNTRKTESLFQIHIDIDGQFYNNKPQVINYLKTFEASSTEYIGLNYSKKLYGTNRMFFSYGIFSLLNPSTSVMKNEQISSSYKNTTKQFKAEIKPSIGIGIGRIESVKDSRQAVYILEELSKRDVLTRHCSEDEIFNFSQLISRVKNKRFLDYRLHKIDEITSIDSFLVKNNMLTKSDASYFSTLYDNWENSANFERTTGQSFEVSLSPNIYWTNMKSESKVSNPVSDTWNKQIENIYGAKLAFNYNYAKQIKSNWEKTVNVLLIASSKREQDRHSTESNQDPLLQVNSADIVLYGNYCIGYYPSTRTNLSTRISQNLSQTFYDNLTSNSWSNSFYSATNLEFKAVYYVSPQLSLSGNTSIFYAFQNYRNSDSKSNQNNLGLGFNVALKYSFF
jgi:hypothetical protein